MVSCPNPCQISPLDTVYTHTLLESGVILVKCSEQCLVLIAYALIGIAHHFSRYVCLTVGYALIVLDDLRLDVIQCEVDVPRFGTFAFGSVSFRIPKGFRNGLLATELRYSSVDCHSSHDGNNSVFLLAAVHIEQHFECTSCHTRFLFAKLYINELDLDTQIGDKRCNSILHVLNLTLLRVMICKPIFFLNPLFLAFSVFSACHHLTP